MWMHFGHTKQYCHKNHNLTGHNDIKKVHSRSNSSRVWITEDQADVIKKLILDIYKQKINVNMSETSSTHQVTWITNIQLFRSLEKKMGQCTP